MKQNATCIAIGERWTNRTSELVLVTSHDVHGYWVVEEKNPANGYLVNVHGEYVDNDTNRPHLLDLVEFVGLKGPAGEPGPVEMLPDLPVYPIDMSEPGYELLANVLQRAYDQASKGKGKERHANSDPFENQVMQDGARRFGTGALLFQAFKKSEESQRLPLDRGVNELLGAIVYLAGAVIRREADGV